MTKIPVLALCLSFAAVAAPREKVELVTTDRVALPAGSVIHVEGSKDELNIEGWDQPSVRIVTTRYSYPRPGRKERTAEELKQIQVTTSVSNGELTVSTSKYRLRGVHLDYRIMVPRTSRLVIRHGIGDVIVMNVDGGIEAKARAGDIFVQSRIPPPRANLRLGIGGVTIQKMDVL